MWLPRKQEHTLRFEVAQIARHSAQHHLWQPEHKGSFIKNDPHYPTKTGNKISFMFFSFCWNWLFKLFSYYHWAEKTTDKKTVATFARVASALDTKRNLRGTWLMVKAFMSLLRHSPMIVIPGNDLRGNSAFFRLRHVRAKVNKRTHWHEGK